MATKRMTKLAKPQKISRSQLIELIKDLAVSDEELAKYFEVNATHSDGFSPSVVVNQALLEDDGLEGAKLLNAANSIARWRRNRRYRKRVKNWNGVKIVAEGDSWFQYPLLLKDTIDQLSDLDNFRYAIFGLSEAGDLLSNIVAEDELTQAIEKENPDVFLISGGGNDMVGDGRMATLVHDYKKGRKAIDYPNQRFDEFLAELRGLYRALFSRLLQRFPHLKIVCHGYDNVIPANGVWLGKPLISKNIKSATTQRHIVAEMIRRFNEELVGLVSEFPGAVYHVDCRKLIGAKTKWHDELHPKNDGFLLVAKLFDDTIKRAIAGEAPSLGFEGRLSKEMLPGLSVGAKPLTGLMELGDQEFADLVVARAQETMKTAIAPPKDKPARREIESSLEKVNLQTDFLPSSFLEVGVERAQSVCRISTKVPLGTAFGSGFLIGGGDYIMTNNHVLPDEEAARASNVLFDYDQDTVEYSVPLKSDKFFLTSTELDFTIVACDSALLPATVKAIVLPIGTHLITRKERVNIVQHPQGRRKEIALHDNTVTYVYDKAIRYTTDTEGGSSGSPVFNNQWQLCALHHAGWKNDDGTASNEGIQISAILEYLNNIDDPTKVAAVQQILAGKEVREVSSPASESPVKNGKLQEVTININYPNTNLTVNVNN